MRGGVGVRAGVLALREGVRLVVELAGVAAVHDPEPEGVRAGPRQGVVLGHPGMGGDSIRRSPSEVHLATRW